MRYNGKYEEEIRKLKDKLEELINNRNIDEGYNNEEILKISREIDSLISKSYTE